MLEDLERCPVVETREDYECDIDHIDDGVDVMPAMSILPREQGDMRR
jgi:hypothetical protein